MGRTAIFRDRFLERLNFGAKDKILRRQDLIDRRPDRFREGRILLAKIE